MASVRDLSGHPLPTPGPITAAMDLTGWASWMTSPQLIRDANRRYVGADPYVKGPLNAQVLKRVEIKVAGSSAFELNPPLHGLFLLAGSNKCRFGRGARDLNPGPHGPESRDSSSKYVGFCAFQFDSSSRRARTVEICTNLQPDCYMEYYRMQVVVQKSCSVVIRCDRSRIGAQVTRTPSATSRAGNRRSVTRGPTSTASQTASRTRLVFTNLRNRPPSGSLGHRDQSSN